MKWFGKMQIIRFLFAFFANFTLPSSGFLKKRETRDDLVG